MKIIEPGHVYHLNFLDVPPMYDLDDDRPELPSNLLTFVNREEGHQHPGTQVQEVLRALIDRTYHCDNCMPHELNAMIVHHLRMALVFHEMRAMERKVERNGIHIETYPVGTDGHIMLQSPKGLSGKFASNAAPRRNFPLKPRQQECKRREY